MLSVKKITLFFSEILKFFKITNQLLIIKLLIYYEVYGGFV